MTEIGIRSIGTSVPEKILTNDDLVKMVDTTDEWITTRTGIKERHILGPDEKLRPHVVAAARTALERAGLQGKDAGFIISSTVIPDRFCPALAYEIAHDLQVERALAFDLNAACSGMIYGLAIAESFLQTRDLAWGLVTGAEQMSTGVDYTDRAGCILFGDAAAAIVVTKERPMHRILATELGSIPSLVNEVHIGGVKDVLNGRMKDYWFRQNGATVMKFAVRILQDLCERVPRKAGIDPAAVRYVVPHQANQRILDAAARGVSKNAEFISVLEKYGNTSSSSVGLALNDTWDRFKPGDLVLLIAFGGGLSWAGALIEW
ncbi:MAG: beta-ketoacyl-ACP synthase 3 [Candidatus Aminicenantes bacterium]|nr:beta-ketoacyl-ACP synthase 3 [Candidatus Aminicenantes bacterium]